jgi:hypothetical protein
VPTDPFAELKWLKDNPAFNERPATFVEFLGKDYLNVERKIRVKIRECLQDIMGKEVSGIKPTLYPRAMITGGIGIGKTTIASITLPYLAHWVLCLKDPQDFFDLLAGSRIAFMQMSTSEKQAKEVVFGDIKARIQHSPWFRDNFPYDTSFTTQLRFPKEIWILPGDSAETSFEGYNILGGILDEADSHKVTKEKDYASDGYDAINSRVESRFQDRGFVLVIGQMKKSQGFAATKYKEFKDDPDAYTARLAIWESLGWEKFLKPDGTRDSFLYDIKRKAIVPPAAGLLGSEQIIEVPNTYRNPFTVNPEKALRDLAGIPPAVGDPFISLEYKVTEARDRWVERNTDAGVPLPSPFTEHGKILPWFRAQERLKRVAHVDIAFSADGDAAAIAVGHVREVVEIDGEHKPYVVYDILARWRAAPGTEIMLGELRRFLYALRDDFGFNIKRVTMDGFQSTDTRQQLAKRRFESEHVSPDKSKLPYEDLREAIYEDRVEFPPLMVYLNPGDTDLVEIAVKELTELTDVGLKIDHPHKGSKDVADAMAGVMYTLMGDRSYRRKVVNLDSYRDQKNTQQATGTGGPMGGMTHPALGIWGQGATPAAPVPPMMGDVTTRPPVP